MSGLGKLERRGSFIIGRYKKGPASVVVPIDKLSMLVTIAFSWIVFHEKLTKKSAVGVLLITAGTLLLAVTA